MTESQHAQLTAASDFATERYREVTAQVGGAFDDFTRTGRDLVGTGRTVVGRGADVKEPATVAHTELCARATTPLAERGLPLPAALR